jgi:hypothetical protein
LNPLPDGGLIPPVADDAITDPFGQYRPDSAVRRMHRALRRARSDKRAERNGCARNLFGIRVMRVVEDAALNSPASG